MAEPYTVEFEFRNRRYKDAAKGLAAFAQQLAKDWDGTAKVLSNELKDFLDSVAEALAERHGNPWPGGTTQNTLSKRTGGLVQTILDSVEVKGTSFGDLQGFISAGSLGFIHEFGGVIKPKTAKFLTVPLPAALDNRGVPLKQSARDWPNTFVAKSRAGNLIIFQKRASQIIPLYVLKTSVTIPARLGFRKTLDAGLPYFVERAMDKMMAQMRIAA